MQFGIKTSPQYTTWGDMLDVWRTADAIDVFESAWNFDHFYPINSADSNGPCLEAWTMLAAVAENATCALASGRPSGPMTCTRTGMLTRESAGIVVGTG